MSRILVIVERFYPEDFLVNDLVKAWKEAGDEIEVLTQVPSYPFDRIYDGYENRRYQVTREYLDVPVHRVSTIFGYNASVRRKVLNYLHFGWRTAAWCLRNGRRFDAAFVYHTAALTMAAGVFPLKLLWRRPVAIWTQDLWPDAVYAYGFRPTRLRRLLLDSFVRAVYACCAKIAVSCPSYVGRIRALTGREAVYVPQWDPTEMRVEARPAAGDGAAAAPRKKVFMFAGNLGTPQNLPNLVEGFARAARPDAELWLVGGGVMLEPLKELVAERKIPGVVFKGRQPKAEMGRWFAQADALVISLSADYRLTFPGKVQSYLKTGRPLLGALEGDAREMIDAEKLGLTASPDDLDAIARAFREFPFDRSEEMGARCLRLSRERFDRATLVARLRALLPGDAGRSDA